MALLGCHATLSTQFACMAGAMRTGAREGDTQGVEALPLPSHVSLARVRSLCKAKFGDVGLIDCENNGKGMWLECEKPRSYSSLRSHTGHNLSYKKKRRAVSYNAALEL